MYELMYAAEAVVDRSERSGEMVSFPSGQISRTGSTLKCGLGLALAWSSFAVVNKSRPPAMFLLLWGRRPAIPGRLERGIGDPVIVEEKFASGEVEGSKDKVEVEENVRKNVENELARARI